MIGGRPKGYVAASFYNTEVQCPADLFRVTRIRFQTVKHFTSWPGLCPGTRINGGNVLSAATKRSFNRPTQALKLAAATLRRSQSALGAYCRRM